MICVEKCFVGIGRLPGFGSHRDESVCIGSTRGSFLMRVGLLRHDYSALTEKLSVVVSGSILSGRL